MENAKVPDGFTATNERFSIANEFTGVWVTKVMTRNGERLEINVPKLGRTIYLDAMQLEILARQDPEALARFNVRTLESEFDAED